MSSPRSLLFVPGNNERMLKKALSPALDCDCVIFDLEDSVPLDQKESARNLVRQILRESNNLAGVEKKKRICVRINQLDGPLSKADIAFLSKESIDNFVIPKAEDEGIRKIFRETGKHMIPIIETAKGFLRMEEIATREGVDALTYGAADMALSMHGSMQTYQNNEYTRTRLAIVARSLDLDPIDQVFFDLKDLVGFKREAIQAKNLGYSGKLLIHPTQIEVANEVFSSWTKEEVVWAKQVIHAYDASLKQGGGAKGAIDLNGQLVDAVHYKLAKDILKGSSGG